MSLITRGLYCRHEYSATSYKHGIVSQRLGVHIQSPALNYGLKKHRLGCNIRSPQIKARVNNNPEVKI